MHHLRKTRDSQAETGYFEANLALTFHIFFIIADYTKRDKHKTEDSSPSNCSYYVEQKKQIHPSSEEVIFGNRRQNPL